MTAELWGNIPAELRLRDQWVIASPDKTPLSLDAQGRVYAASHSEPSQWLPFDVAANYAYAHGLAVGYVLSRTDPYACIDFDVCDAETQARKGEPIDPSKWTTQEEFNWFWQLVLDWDTYTERSLWGKGLHVWVVGNLPKGVRRKPIEIYSQERYIICTGNVVHKADIKNRSQWLESLAAGLTGALPQIDLVEKEPTLTDQAVYERLVEADNSIKSLPLWNGYWQQMQYPSQSEADLALMSMLAFYSESNEQCRRLFRMSALGRRDKAVKNNRYLDYTLRVIRARQASEQKADFSAMLLRREEKDRIGTEKEAGLHATQLAHGVPTTPPPMVTATLAAPIAREIAQAPDGLPWPPGMAGAIAHFIYQSAPRPVREVAIVAALGVLAGVCGKAFYIPGSGLNLYIVLVARSAVGKEAMHSGISALCNGVVGRCPDIMRFVNFTDFASGPALIKSCVASESFVHVAGEFGKKLRRFSADMDGRDTAMSTLRTLMIDLYQKSGPQSIVGGITYSNEDNNIASISGVAYSMIGETTPKTFYDALTEEMMEDGFLSRFTVIQYDGERPPLNTAALRTPPTTLVEAFGSLATHARTLILQGKNQGVSASPEAAALFQAFELECDSNINSTTDERWRQMWNRASLKVMRISALLAVADNWHHPCIEPHYIEWAKMVVLKDIAIMTERLESGDVGVTDDAREQKVKALIYEACTADYLPPSYGLAPVMAQAGVVTYNYLNLRTARISAFYKHKSGSSTALAQTIRALIDSGYIEEIGKDDLRKNWSYAGKAYRIAKALVLFKQV